MSIEKTYDWPTDLATQDKLQSIVNEMVEHLTEEAGYKALGKLAQAKITDLKDVVKENYTVDFDVLKASAKAIFDKEAYEKTRAKQDAIEEGVSIFGKD